MKNGLHLLAEGNVMLLPSEAMNAQLCGSGDRKEVKEGKGEMGEKKRKVKTGTPVWSSG